MRAFLAIMKLELVSALRSKTMLLFALGCTLWMTLGRNILKGASTGTYELSVRYLLGVVFSIVLVSLGAAAAGALSTDRAAKRLQLTMIRPVPHSVIAMARALAITLVGSSVIALALVFLWAFEGRGRTCDKVYAPVMESTRTEAERMFRDLYASNAVFRAEVERVGERDIYTYLETQVRDTYESVAPGKTASWDFSNVPDGIEAAGVRVRFIDFFGRPGSVVGSFSFAGFTGVIDNAVKTRFYVPLSNRSAEDSNGKALRFTNGTTASLSLQPRKDLHLLVKADSFAWNALRAWLVMSFMLMIVVSTGVFLGSCLGRGVAVFSLMSLLIVMVITPAAMDEYLDPTESNAATRMGMRMTEFSAMLTSPMNKFSPVSSLEADECIGWGEIGEAAATGAFYLALFSLMSGLVMSRKQD